MPALELVTPVILTYNEDPNIGRTLDCLTWAERVVVVDSGSDDGTIELVRSFPNTELFERKFDGYAGQWNHGLGRVSTPWTLALDADYQLPSGLVAEIEAIPDDTPKNGFYAEFDYMVLGRRLRRHLYPPRQVLFRTARAIFEDDGHTQRVRVEGASGRLRHRILHDDRKPLERWLRNQAHYARQEARKLKATPWSGLSVSDRIRRTGVCGPPAAFVYCLFVKGLVLEGWPGWYYTLERIVAEGVLALTLLRRETDRQVSSDPRSRSIYRGN